MSRLLDLLFPPNCVLCRGAVSKGMQICDTCADEIQGQYRLQKHISIAECSDAAAALQYKGKVQRALLSCKYGQKNIIGKWGGEIITACLADHLPEWKPDCVTYVPTTLGHWWKRGFHLPTIFAAEAAKQCGLPCIRTLRRKWFAKSQLKTHSAQDRHENAKHTYSLYKEIDLTGKRIVLVDDVLTTGATATACAAILREMGAAEVFFVSLAKSQNKRKSAEK